jgi:hypothetical protein
MTTNGRWVYARDLKFGDTIRSRSLDTQKVTALESSTIETLVYNFLVDDLHNYTVGENEILVHNTNSPKRSEHAEIRASQGRPVGNAISDARKASMKDVFIQDDGRYIVVGKKGRVHIFESDNVIVTSIRTTHTNIVRNVKNGRWQQVSESQFEIFRKMLNQ